MSPLNENQLSNSNIFYIPEDITSIAVTVDTPIVGKNLKYSLALTSNPDGALKVSSYNWYQISKNNYTGAVDAWEGISGGDTFEEGYYYRAVLRLDANDGFDNNYMIPDDIPATINGKNCDTAVATDGKSCQLSYIFEAKVLQPVSNIAVTLDEPALGETPDFEPKFTAIPAGSVKLDECLWYKISEDDYTGTDQDYWDDMYEDDVFEEGYYYSVDLYFTPNENYSLNEGISATVNGKPHDDTYGLVYDEGYAEAEAYVSGVFGPLEPQYTLAVPFTTTVKLGGNAVPGETVFDLAVVDANAGEETYADVTVSGSVTTNGAGDYEGVMTFTGPSQQLWNMLCEGAFVKQVDGGEEGWTYDDTVWGLCLSQIATYSTADSADYIVLILPATCEKTENGMYYDLEWEADPVEQMSFTNTYTKSITEATESNPNTGATTTPQTGDNSNLTLWFVLLAVSAAGVIGTGVYSKRRRSARAK